jgi:hypothetical protein
MRRDRASRDAWTGASARVAGLAAVVLFHACVVLALVVPPPAGTGHEAQDPAILVRFVERPRKPAHPPAARSHASGRDERRSPAAGATDRAPRSFAASGLQAETRAAGGGHPLQLALPLAAVAIPDDPLRRPDRSALAAPERLHVEIADRSFGGTLQRMARARACGELRSALVNSPNSAAAIRRSMERYRCTG